MKKLLFLFSIFYAITLSAQVDERKTDVYVVTGIFTTPKSTDEAREDNKKMSLKFCLR